MSTQPSFDRQSERVQTIWVILLISLCLLLCFQALRVFVATLVTAYGERVGQTNAAGPALIVFIAPALAALFASRLKPREFLWVTAGGLAVLRLLMQLSREIYVNMILAGLAIPLAIMGLVLVFGWLNKGRSIVPTTASDHLPLVTVLTSP